MERPERHHALWERRSYTTPLEKQVRKMATFILDVAHYNHRLLHASMAPPPKPDVDTLRIMREASSGGLLAVLNRIEHPIGRHIERQLEIISMPVHEAMERIDTGEYLRYGA